MCCAVGLGTADGCRTTNVGEDTDRMEMTADRIETAIRRTEEIDARSATQARWMSSRWKRLRGGEVAIEKVSILEKKK